MALKGKMSFAEYIKENFYDPIYDRVKSYIFGNRNKFDLTSPRIYPVTETTLEDIDIRHINAEDTDPQGTKITFYPIVLATVGISGRTRDDYDMDTKDFMFRLHCTADLGKALDDFKIVGIEEYYSRKKYENALTDSLVPYIPVEKMDDKAEEILKAYYPEVLHSPQKVKTRELAKRMGLRVTCCSITEDASVFGQIYFDETVSVLYNRKKGKKVKVTVPANMILVDDLASLLYSPTSARLTIAHECVHFALHRKAFELERLCNQDFTKIQCQTTGDISSIDRSSNTSWMEWHANYLAPRLLMPKSTFRQKADELIAQRLAETGETEVLEVIEWVIDELAGFFGVSRQAAKRRMVDIGFEEAIGAYTYIDGHYVRPTRPHKKGIINEKKTYSISAQDVSLVSFADRDLSNEIQKGKYIFVDSHLVLNTPKYVEINDAGEQALTGYARYHMDECCLLFDIALTQKYDIEQRYYSYCILNRDVNSPYEMQISFHNGYANCSDEKQTEYLRKAEDDSFQIFSSLPRDFKGAIEALKDWRKMTNQDIADLVLCDERTIRRIINGETSTTIQTIVSICMALKLPPQIAFYVIEHSPVKFSMMDQEHYKLHTLIMTGFGKSMDEVRKLARQLNIANF